MAQADKVATVAEIAERFRSSTAALITEYRGLTMAQLTELRRSLGTDTAYTIAKNTLVKRAAADAGVQGLDELFVGPTAVAFVSGEPVDAAKALREFARAHPLLVIKGGLLDGRALEPAEVTKLADLESREVLLAKLAGAMKASLTKAAIVFNALPTKTAQLIAALQEKKAADGDADLGVTESVEAATETATDTATEPATDTATDTATETATDTATAESTEETADASA
jgi:large subunit ribosomal protein L10